MAASLSVTTSSESRRCVLLIAYVLLLFVGELSIETSRITPAPFADSNKRKSCVGRLEVAPFGPGSAKLTLCNIGNYAYAAYVKVGTPGYGSWLEIDTGSADSWIMTSDCISPSCALRRRFSMENSSDSLWRLQRNFNLTFGHGVRAQGQLIRDRLCFAKDTCLPNRILGAVGKISQTGMYADGILGLGSDSLSRFPATSRKPCLLAALAELQSSNDSRSRSHRLRTLFGLRLNRHIFFGDDEDGGELTLGYLNMSGASPSLRLPLVPDNGGYWMVGLSKLQLSYSCTDPETESCNDIRRVPLVTALGGNAILDTGSTYILSSSQSLRSELNRWLQKGWVEAAGGHLVTDCSHLSSLPSLHFLFCLNRNCTQRHKLALSPEQYTFPFDPKDTGRRRVGVQFTAGLPFTVLGTSFLSNFHTTFDFGQKHVALAQMPSRTWSSTDLTKNSTVERYLGEAGRRVPFEDFMVCLVTVTAVLLIPFR